ncbi:MAG: ABC transporter permease [Gemmatimonadales bacterium]|nr:ABC transporter permease [Gemmatimonadales bacterium]
MGWRFWQPSLPREVDEELAFHLDMRVRDLIAAGLSPADARREAGRRFGDLGAVAAECRTEGARRNRRMGRMEWLRELRQDAAYGLRSLRRNPGFTAVALATLALGLGGTTAIFSAVNAVVLRPLAIPRVDRVMLASEFSDGHHGSVSVGNFVDWQRANVTRPMFQGLGSINWRSETLTGDEPERILAAEVTAEYFRIMDVRPLVGRVFSEEEDRPGAPAVVVLSHRLWQRRLGGDSALVGRTILLSGRPHAVVGIMPATFDFRADSEELWVPAAFTPAQRAQHDEHYLTVYGRLRDGVTPAAAEAMLVEAHRELTRLYPNANGNGTVRLQPMMEQFVGDARQQLFLVFGAVALVLLIACANVANLLLSRGAARSREFAIRASIGAGRGRIVRQLLAESGVLAVLATALGAGLAWAVIRALTGAAPAGVPRLDQTRLDLAALGFAAALAVGSTLLFGLAPALRAARADLQSTLRTGQARGAGGRRDFLRQALIAGEVALALMLLVGATLLVRTAIHVQRVDPGFEPRGLVTARLTLPAERYAVPEAARGTFESVLANLAASPGVRGAALTTQVPMGPGGGDNGLIPEGKPLESSSAVGSALRIVTPGYVRTMGMVLQRGRDFGPDDRAGMPRVMLMNETLARALFPGQDPIGKRVACCEGGPNDPKWKTIVGVVEDTRSRGLDRDPVREFFLPMTQAPDVAWNWIGRTMSLVARTEGDPLALAPALREAVRRVDPALPLYRLGTMEGTVSTALAPARFRTALLSSLAGVGLLLSLVGIYGVVSYLVTRRRGEIGVRMALGATPRHVMRLVVGQGLAPVLIGTAIGTLGAFAATRLLASWLRGVSPTDPLTFAAVVVVLVGTAAVASLVPARRATKVDALEAIRTE